MATPVYVISGPLGAGKTTLLNGLLESAPPESRIMVLVNELGKISIDRKLVRADPERVVDLSGGCVCCGLFFELVSSIRFALEVFHAEGIWIECTGLAVPREVVRQALSPIFEGRVTLGAVLTVVEPADLRSGESALLRAQLEDAQVAVLNKLDTATPAERPALRAKVEALAPPGCVCWETTHGRLRYPDVVGRSYDGAALLDRLRATPPASFDSTAGFTAVSLVHRGVVPWAELDRLFRAFGERILRAKGRVRTEEGQVLLQVSRSGLERTRVEGELPASELVVIVRDADRREVEGAFSTVFSRRLE